MSSASTYLRLEVISGVAPGSTLVVEDELVIGRHASGAGRLSEDEEISRQHARISREATGDYAIEDLGSSNGTFVNGLRIQSPRLLALGDSIETGATTLVVKEVVRPQPVEVASAGEARPAAEAPPAAEARSAPTVFARVPAVVEQAAAGESPPATTPSPTPPEPAERAGQALPPPLKLEVDFDARELRVAPGQDGETLRLIFKDGAWRVG